MTFQGFTKSDFDTFTIDGLDDRMEAIQTRIQPKFQEIGTALSEDVSALVGKEMFLHIARHARRTVNPPKDTWMALADDKRGYKKHPHFQVGLFDDHLFIWLAFIYELPNKEQIATKFLENSEAVHARIPKNYVISQDHMQKEAVGMDKLGVQDLEKILTRFRDVKKAEFLVGRHISVDDPLLQDGERFLAEVRDTFEQLIPLYGMAYSN
ncbi:YktB family protein [Bacillus fonticola]|uniref:YktB family protein n=1 Tax=Bacillus fonticola TaxID=2728853 RepID=UPI0014739395|nr:DUF1054 domain-containing protein [Bacillus fonticola]